MPLARQRLALITLLGVVVVGAWGCDKSSRFSSDELRLVDRRIVPAHREQLSATLEELFGTPDEPRVPEAAAELLDVELLRQAAGPVESHTEGVTHGLYRRHCARCHGLTGDGRGPTALYQAPYPRDFRTGVFKFKSTERGAAPTDADLHATITRGVSGTAMPSFHLLTEEERSILVAYVKYLVIRGRTEESLIELMAEEFDFDPATGEVGVESTLSVDSPEGKQLIDAALAKAIKPWRAGTARVVAVDETSAAVDTLLDPDRVEAGRVLFHDARRANCAKCHGVGGVGGVALDDYDDWNKRRYEFAGATDRKAASIETMRERLLTNDGSQRERFLRLIDEEEQTLRARREVEASMLPPRRADPRRLAGGALRGAGDLEQLFRVIHEGVAGAPMPAAGAALSDDEIWSLVAYVQSLLAAPSPTTVANE